MITREFTFAAAIRQQPEGTWLVRFRDLPEALTEGETFEEALVEAVDALEEAIAGRVRRGDEIPRGTPARTGEQEIAVPPVMAAKAALYLATRNGALTKSQLAKRLGIDEKEGRRLLDPHHPTKIQRLQDALEAVGQTLVVRVESRPVAAQRRKSTKNPRPTSRADQPAAGRAARARGGR